ncbi:hypothetical protein [Bradyrhizobium betae]|uniref:hypothetical protein n=1 Tax=Bradyrhizobium betae TaxID=244734 RepID=UPI0013E8FC83|nr:hypothetical protein [Bradyrhizobium betae]
MLDRTEELASIGEGSRLGKSLLSITYFGLIGIAMIAWIAAMVWVSWQVITWLL